MSNYSDDLVGKAVGMKSDSSGGFPGKQTTVRKVTSTSRLFFKIG